MRVLRAYQAVLLIHLSLQMWHMLDKLLKGAMQRILKLSHVFITVRTTRTGGGCSVVHGGQEGARRMAGWVKGWTTHPWSWHSQLPAASAVTQSAGVCLSSCRQHRQQQGTTG